MNARWRVPAPTMRDKEHDNGFIQQVIRWIANNKQFELPDVLDEQWRENQAMLEREQVVHAFAIDA